MAAHMEKEEETVRVRGDDEEGALEELQSSSGVDEQSPVAVHATQPPRAGDDDASRVADDWANVGRRSSSSSSSSSRHEEEPRWCSSALAASPVSVDDEQYGGHVSKRTTPTEHSLCQSCSAVLYAQHWVL